MGLVVLRLVASDVRVEVEGFLMVSVDDASNRIFDVGSSVRLQRCLIEIVLVLGVGQGSGVGLEFLDVLLDLFPPFLLLFGLFLELSLPNTLPDLLVLVVFFAPLVGCAG